MLVVALLLAALSALAVSRPPARRRLEAVVPRVGAVPESRWDDATLHRLAAGLLGVIAFLLVGGPSGALVGVALALGAPALLTRRATAWRRDAGEDTGLPMALDLLAACLRGGATLAEAVGAVAVATPGAVGLRLARVEASLAVGAPAEEAFHALGEDGPGGSAARTLRRSLEGGTPVAAAMSRVAEEARRSAAVAAEKRARAVGTMVLAPLGACFLPAFVLLGIVPAMVAIGSGLVGEIT